MFNKLTALFVSLLALGAFCVAPVSAEEAKENSICLQQPNVNDPVKCDPYWDGVTPCEYFQTYSADNPNQIASSSALYRSGTNPEIRKCSNPNGNESGHCCVEKVKCFWLGGYNVYGSQSKTYCCAQAKEDVEAHIKNQEKDFLETAENCFAGGEVNGKKCAEQPIPQQ